LPSCLENNSSQQLRVRLFLRVYLVLTQTLLTPKYPHRFVLTRCKHLEKQGFKVTYLPVGVDGLVDLALVEEAITNETVLVSVMYANNEIGVIQPIKEIAKEIRHARKNMHSPKKANDFEN
jgi:cysteine desulfurase